MKKNSLTTAVVAGIAGVAGFAGLASAVNLNPDGIGQVLVFPYYTVNKSQDTMLSVVNTTDIGKAVKVRFLEGLNSRECLDFNVFLSAYDVWTASVFDLGRTDPASGFGTPDYDPYTAEIGPALFTRDVSCTIPYFVTGADADGQFGDDFYVAFRPFNFGSTGPQGVSRCREGHFEMITMGDIIPGSDLDLEITHEQVVVGGQQQPGQGVPSCDPNYVNNAQNGAVVAGDLNPPTGGIYGSGAVINVGQGTFFGYNADAIEGFYQNQGGNLYSASGDTEPSLGRAATEADGSATAYTFQNGNLIIANYAQGIDAVSAVFMADAIYNQFEVSPSIGAATDWVVTFPTKKYYVDPDLVAAPVQPFVELFDDTTPDRSCVQVDLDIFDREEASRVFIPGTCNISPCPPLPGPPVNSICRETNVLSFQDGGDVSSVLGSRLVQNIEPFGTAGHAIIGFDPAAEPHALTASTNGVVFRGLPATGFQASSLVNNGLTIDGTTNVLSNYSGLFRHRISRDCRDVTGAPCS